MLPNFDILTVAPSKVSCPDPCPLMLGRTRFLCLAFLRSWERTWKNNHISTITYNLILSKQNHFQRNISRWYLNALPSWKQERDRNTSDSRHLYIVVNVHQLVQKPLWKISILQFQNKNINCCEGKKHGFKYQSTSKYISNIVSGFEVTDIVLTQ